MACCSVVKCKNNKKFQLPESTISFHRFPKDPFRREQWVKFVNRKSWQPSKYSMLCSTHFAEQDIDRTSLSYVRIRDFAVPTLRGFQQKKEIEIAETDSNSEYTVSEEPVQSNFPSDQIYIANDSSINDEIKREFESNINDEIKQELENSINDEIEQETHSGINDGIKQELESSINDEIEQETHSGINDGIKQEIETSINDRIKQELDIPEDLVVSTESRNELDSLGNLVTLKLKRMEERQRNISENLIHQILFHGLSNRLYEEVFIGFPIRSQTETHPQTMFLNSGNGIDL